MNVHQIEVALSQKISAASTNFDLLAASKALQLLRTNGIFVVSSYGGLPAAASNEGKIYFIEDIETVVWSNGTDWLKLLDKNTIQFQLFSWGSNSYGTLGNGAVAFPNFNSCSPVREFCSATDWSQVSANGTHVTAIKTSGQLWVWGCNNRGQLGDGTTVARCSPVREFCSATDWCQVNGGGCSTAAIKTSGELWVWGNNQFNTLGDGTATCRCSPVREFCSATDWCQVDGGGLAMAAIKTSGQLWAWGYNRCGILGDGTVTTRCSPVRERSCSIDWCQVSMGSYHTLAVKTSGQLWTWGQNCCGSLGTGSVAHRCSPVREICSTTDWCQVSVGRTNSVAVKTSGQVWTWGQNECGILAVGTVGNSCSPVREFCSATDWCQVSSGACHVLAIKTTGELWSWGAGASGRLGDGTVTEKCSPVREISSSINWNQVSGGSQFTAAIKLII